MVARMVVAKTVAEVPVEPVVDLPRSSIRVCWGGFSGTGYHASNPLPGDVQMGGGGGKGAVYGHFARQGQYPVGCQRTVLSRAFGRTLGVFF